MFLKCLLIQLVNLCQKCLDYLPQNYMLLNMLLVLTHHQFVLLSKPSKLKCIFDFDFPLFCKHCYLYSFHLLLTLPLHNTSGGLYEFPQLNFFVFHNLIFVTGLISFIITAEYGWFFLLPIAVLCSWRSLSLSCSSAIDDLILLTILFCVVLAVFSFCLSCFTF